MSIPIATSSTSSEVIAQKEQLACFLWTGFIIMFFAIQAIIWTVAILLTSNDSSHAMVHSFDVKSAGPPSQAEQLQANRRLGWSAKLTWLPNIQNSFTPQQDIILAIVDKDSQPVQATAIEMSAFHCSQAAKAQQIELKLQEPGMYLGTLTINKSGQWQIDAVIKRGEDVYYLNERVTK